jgi:hypothetical protein
MKKKKVKTRLPFFLSVIAILSCFHCNDGNLKTSYWQYKTLDFVYEEIFFFHLHIVARVHNPIFTRATQKDVPGGKMQFSCYY